MLRRIALRDFVIVRELELETGPGFSVLTGETGAGKSILVDALQRVPGVTAETRGQATELKLGGLGAGYTQVLLNGEPLPRGVSLDSIALDSIERVEITRGSTVQSSQAIAGSINFITRRPSVPVTRSLSLSAASACRAATGGDGCCTSWSSCRSRAARCSAWNAGSILASTLLSRRRRCSATR